MEQTWIEDATRWKDGTTWAGLANALAPNLAPAPGADDMEAMNEIIALIDKRVAESEARLNTLSQQIDKLKQVKKLLQSGLVSDLLTE